MDEWKGIGSGLFQLYRAGGPTSLTSFVDRSRSRAEQLEQLSEAGSWLPEQVLVEAFEQIARGDYQAPDPPGETSIGRVFAPTPTRLPVLLAPGDTDGAHPLRPYLWPTLRGGQLLLEDGETVLEDRVIAAPISMEYAEGVHSYVTSSRIVVTGKLALPSSVRSDYKLSLGLASPALMEGFAALKAIGRIGQNRDRYWVQHLRYEWLTSISCMTTTRLKKKLFGGTAPPTISKWVRGELRLPSGKTGLVDIARFEEGGLLSSPEPTPAERAAGLLAHLESACRSLRLEWTAGESTTRTFPKATEDNDVWSVDRRGAYTVPIELIGAAPAT